MKFKYLEEVATADIAFEAYGKDMRELFENTALAVAETMVDVKTVSAKEKKEIELEENDIQQLLFEFVEELIYIKDADHFVFKKFDLELKEGKRNKLKVTCYGDEIDKNKQDLRNDVKAITYHMYKLEKVKQGYKVLIVLDV